MRIASKKTLLKAFPSLTNEQALLIRRIGKARDDAEKLRALIEKECEETHKYALSCYGDPFDSEMWRTFMALHAIDCILGTCGVESLGKGRSFRDPPPYQYCNTGDTYDTTLIYKEATDTLFVGCWGDIVERHEKELNLDE